MDAKKGRLWTLMSMGMVEWTALGGLLREYVGIGKWSGRERCGRVGAVVNPSLRPARVRSDHGARVGLGNDDRLTSSVSGAPDDPGRQPLVATEDAEAQLPRRVQEARGSRRSALFAGRQEVGGLAVWTRSNHRGFGKHMSQWKVLNFLARENEGESSWRRLLRRLLPWKRPRSRWTCRAAGSTLQRWQC